MYTFQPKGEGEDERNDMRGVTTVYNLIYAAIRYLIFLMADSKKP